MPLDIIVGAQWGDEGKGRVVDLLSAKADFVARYNGGDNAGHTVSARGQTFRLHLIPSGMIHAHTVGVIGNGVVVNPAVLLEEVQTLRSAGLTVDPGRLTISHAAHLITPGHQALDAVQEAARGAVKIGTTLRGIGPAYTDKVSRNGLRMEQMLDPQSFGEALRIHLGSVNEILVNMYTAEPLDVPAVIREYTGYAHQLKGFIHDASRQLWEALKSGRRVLAEGAQGTLLDLDHGTYPFVTSSSPVAAGALLGLGLGVNWIGRVVGVTKAFQTRVGSGPFPTELSGELATHLRGTGQNPWDEFGTTTGRPRRVGWLDTVLLRYAVRVNGITSLALTKMDILSGMDTIHLCVAYRKNGQVYPDLLLGPRDLATYEAVYEDLPGWEEKLQSIRRWEDLPENARSYILRIEELCGVPVSLASVGPQREQVVEMA